MRVYLYTFLRMYVCVCVCEEAYGINPRLSDPWINRQILMKHTYIEAHLSTFCQCSFFHFCCSFVYLLFNSRWNLFVKPIPFSTTRTSFFRLILLFHSLDRVCACVYFFVIVGATFVMWTSYTFILKQPLNQPTKKKIPSSSSSL